jgi:hypothetical protein
MSQSGVPSFAELLAECHKSAVHLEMRDAYGVAYEAEDFAAWKKTGRWDNREYWRPWMDLVCDAVMRGVVMRRARIVSEPVTDYIRFEHAGTVNNIAAGEQFDGFRGAGHQTSPCPATTSGCSMTGWSSGTTSPATGSWSATN